MRVMARRLRHPGCDEQAIRTRGEANEARRKELRNAPRGNEQAAMRLHKRERRGWLRGARCTERAHRESCGQVRE